MVRLANLWWESLPKSLGALPGLDSKMLRDGAYLLAWRRVAAWLPISALLLGLITGRWHPGHVTAFTQSSGETYTSSLILMAVLLAVSSLGAGVGVWVCLGYVVSDFVFYGHFGYKTGLGLVRTSFALLLSYILLSILLARMIWVSRMLTQRTMLWMRLAARSRLTTELVLLGVIQAAAVWVWVHSVPTLIRPIFTWRGMGPPVRAIQPLQQRGWLLVAIAGLLGGARIVIENYAKQKLGSSNTGQVRRPTLPLAPRGAFPLPVTVRPAMEACSMTFLLSGILTSWLDAATLAGAVFLIRFCNRSVAHILRSWDASISRIPVLFRFAAGIGATYCVAYLILTEMWGRTQTFRPILISVILSLVIITLLTPESRKQPQARSSR